MSSVNHRGDPGYRYPTRGCAHGGLPAYTSRKLLITDCSTTPVGLGCSGIPIRVPLTRIGPYPGTRPRAVLTRGLRCLSDLTELGRHSASRYYQCSYYCEYY
eukprot:2039840-Rhodomonas_salina.2